MVISNDNRGLWGLCLKSRTVMKNSLSIKQWRHYLAPLGLMILLGCNFDRINPIYFNKLSAWNLKFDDQGQLKTLWISVGNDPTVQSRSLSFEKTDNKIYLEGKNKFFPTVPAISWPLIFNIPIQKLGSYELYDKVTNTKFATILINDSIITEAKKVPPAWFNEDGSVIGYGQTLGSIVNGNFK
jgi:hypothetical protein